MALLLEIVELASEKGHLAGVQIAAPQLVPNQPGSGSVEIGQGNLLKTVVEAMLFTDLQPVMAIEEDLPFRPDHERAQATIAQEIRLELDDLFVTQGRNQAFQLRRNSRNHQVLHFLGVEVLTTVVTHTNFVHMFVLTAVCRNLDY
jgi:hypothetical protein